MTHQLRKQNLILNPVRTLLFICDICNQIGSHLLTGVVRKMQITKEQYSVPQNYFLSLFKKRVIRVLKH